MLSYNKKSKSFDNIQKRILLTEYLRMINGVKINNMISSYYQFPHGSRKRWKPVFHRIIDMTIRNLFILTKNYNKNVMTRRYFVLFIVKDLLKPNKFIEGLNSNLFSKGELCNLFMLRLPKARAKKCFEFKKITK